jgi:hypothetical protein
MSSTLSLHQTGKHNYTDLFLSFSNRDMSGLFFESIGKCIHLDRVRIRTTTKIVLMGVLVKKHERKDTL